MSHKYNNQLLNRLQTYPVELDQITQGVQIQVYLRGRKKIDLNVGKTYKYYDLASLTKIIFTTSAYMWACKKSQLSVEDLVVHYLPWFPFKNAKIKELLNHTAGFKAWAPIYKMISDKNIHGDSCHKLKAFLASQKKRRSPKALYSDLDFLTLGLLLEEVFKKPLLHIWSDIAPMYGKRSTLHFSANNKPLYSKKDYAPTEACPWRKQVLRGQVHDDNTWALGGVQAHAGLFGRIEDVSQWGLLLRRAWIKKSNSRAFDSKTVTKFLKRSTPKKNGDWGLGFMLPTSGHASCGQYFSSTSVGHTGFTGTSLWLDPKKDLLVTVLSNRVHPTRENREFVKFRPFIHDQVVEILTQNGEFVA